jgi:hypothetical protein
LRSPLVSRDVAVHGRNTDTANSAYGVAPLRRLASLFQFTGDDANQRASVLLFKEQTFHVRLIEIVSIFISPRSIDDGELLVGELSRDGSNSLLHQEANRDGKVIALRGAGGQVWRVVGVALGLENGSCDAEIRFGFLQALVRERIVPLVAESADVGDETDFLWCCGYATRSAVSAELQQLDQPTC